jgi:hypothetical protein
VHSTQDSGCFARIARTVALLCSLLLLALPASAATLEVLIDSDNNAATGCTVSLPNPPGGSFAGVEVLLVTTVDTSTSPPHVAGVTQQVCSGGSFGAPTVVSAGGWNVGLGIGASGYDAIETVYAPTTAVGRYRLGFAYTDANIGSDVLVTTGGSGSTPIAFAFGSPTVENIPAVGQFGLCALALLINGLAFYLLRRHKAPTMLMLAVLAFVVTTTTWAAIVLDGAITDWNGIAPLTSDVVGDAPGGSDIAAVYATAEANPQRIYFRADVRVAAPPAITSAASTSFTVGTAGSFTVTTSGLPVPALSRGGAALPGGVGFTDNGDGTGTLSGTPVAGSSGSYALSFTATNSTGTSPAQSFALTVNKQAQTIAFTSVAPTTAAVSGATYGVSATATSGLPVSFAIAATSAGVCTLAGSTVSFIGVGTCLINANQAGDASFAAAPQVQQSFTVGKGSQTISFTSTAPVGATVGGATYTVTATASSGLAVTLSIDASASGVCSIAGSTVSFSGAGTCLINANQAGNVSYNAAPQAQQSFAVGKGSQTISFTSTAPVSAAAGGATYSVTATSTSGLAVTLSIDATATSVCTISGSTVSFIGAGTCVIDANQAGNANYNAAAQVQQSFAVKGSQTISFTSTPPVGAAVGGSYNVTATATSGLPVDITIAASSAAVCTLAGSTVSFIGVGTCLINANQAGDASYAAAPQVQQSFAVAKGNQTISFTSTAPVGATFGGATYTVSATATSGLAVTLSVDASASSVCSIAGSTVSFIGAGTCVINANQGGNASYNAAAQAQQSFAVAKASQTLSFTSTPPVSATVGGATYSVTATSTSGLAVTLSIDATAVSVCTISGATVSFIGAGTCVIDANQAGSANYNTAAQVQQSFAVKADQTISFTSTAPVGASVGGSYSVTATATSGLPVDLAIDPAASAICSIAGSTVSFIAAGTCTINANQAGDASYFAAPQVQQSFAITNTQTISFTSVAPTTASYQGTYTVNASATSGLAVTLAIDASTSSVCSIAGSLVTFDGTGTCTINANQPGNASYSAAAQVQQTFDVGPHLVADAYNIIGNTQLVAAGHSAPTTPFTTTASGILGNDSADVAISFTPVTDAATTGGGSITIDATGAFTYTPPAGLGSGTDTYDYTASASGVARSATITFTPTNIVWYVDNASTAASHDGRSNTPFTHMGVGLDGLGSALTNTGPATGATIYVAKGSGSTTGAYTLKSSQSLIGAGATLTLPGLSITGNAANTPTLSGTLSASGASSVTVAGISLSTGASPAVNLVNTGGSFSFRSISASGGSNGIFLQNTTGSFTVDGDGSTTALGGNASGGTIINMSGPDNATTGTAIYLDNVQNVTLRRMAIGGSNQNFGIRGLRVNGFALEYSTVNGTNGTAASLAAPENAGEGSIYFGNTTTNGIATSGSFVSNVIAGGRARNLSIINTTGTTSLTFTGNNFGLNQNFSDANQSLAVEARNAFTTINATAASNVFTGSPGDLANFTGQTGSIMSVAFTGNVLANGHVFNSIGGGGMTLATQGSMTFDVDGNSFRGADGSAVTLFKATDGTLMSGHFRNNTIGATGVGGSGSKSGNGLFWSFAGGGTITLDVSNNQIRQYFGNAGLYADNTGGNYTVNANINNNTIAEPGPLAFAGIALTAGAPAATGDAITVCANITGNNVSTGDPLDNSDIIIGGGATGLSTIRLPGINANPTEADVQTFIFNNNSTAGTTVLAYSDSGTTTFVSGASCPTPSP